ncbi:flagellar basal body P-ring formation chaperone FlgA [Sinimarinibacterium sp. NLF-5-8]|uniref:flagellar basal body P-ring formation chaperone FlgA n=1 Tax=Sinimarinibacterium sp. NLF-5-8 TaxID=2698684 RepID=UPI00137BC88B|nr:flagellar basal body P-ring formation chaperone FlgA [Sinimarinibacterium sp. NLF-5-8]QHS11066.1 flagellar basal body P-ring formation protein FlgA [Sinimarinibacterium sp. NLF-5-8]
MNAHLAPHWLLFAIIALALMPLRSLAQDIEPIRNIEAIAIQETARQLSPNAEISGGAMDPRLRMPACQGALSADPAQIRGANASVAVRCPTPAWSLYVSLKVRDPRPVVVINRSGARGQVLDASMLTLQERDVAQLSFGYFDRIEAALGLALRRPINAGSVLTPNDAEPARIIRRGQSVTITGRSSGIEVRAGGTAMSDGARGQRIRVRNDSSKRIIEAVVVGQGQVETGS